MADTIALGNVVLEFTRIYGWHRFITGLAPLFSNIHEFMAGTYTNLWLAPVHAMTDTIVLCTVVLEFMAGTSEQIAVKLR